MAPPVIQSFIDFPPFRLDLRAGQLRRDGSPVPLRPKTYAVLQHLVERPGELVTKQALLNAIWHNLAVSEDVVRISAGELRAALGDDRARPRFIETVPRRGYRFIAGMRSTAMDGAFAAAAPLRNESMVADGVVVGRASERTEIARWIRTMMAGEPQIGFVTGEAGIGKTTLVDTALGALRRTAGARFRIVHGQCIEHYGDGAPYLPVLAALSTLCRGPDGPAVDEILRRYAPTWLLAATGVLTSGEAARVGASRDTPGHTLHQLATCLDALANETPLVIVLEDVQWSDYATLDLLSVLAQRREPTRRLILCTLRPADAIVSGHPVMGVKRELLRKGLCREILLGGLPAADIAHYIASRFPAADLPADLLPLLVDRSDGSPFFLVTLVDYLLDRGLLVAKGTHWELLQGIERLRTAIPDGLRAVVEPRLERLAPDELRVLEAASVAGFEFTAHAIASATRRDGNPADIEHVERLCDGLARRQEFLRATGESSWPVGTTSTRYAFRHALYREVISHHLPPSTRRRLHQTIGEALEAGHRGQTETVASELAAHFERSRDTDRAIRYHREAASQAKSRFAYGETRLHLEAALALLRSQPETADQLRQQLRVLDDLGWTAFALRGWGDDLGPRVFAQMEELAERSDGARARFQALEGQLIVHTMRAEYAVARMRAEEMLQLAEQLDNQAAVASALPPLGTILLQLGEIEAAHEIAERGRSLCDPSTPTIQGLSSYNLLASTSAHLGLADQARTANNSALALAETLGFPYARAHAANFAAMVYAILGDVASTRTLADEALRIGTECDFSVLCATAKIFQGWCDVREGRVADGITALRGGLTEYAATGQRLSTSSHRLHLAEAYLVNRDLPAANETLQDALAFMDETGERLYEHELYRLKGECILADETVRGRTAAAVEHFERALALAATRKDLLFELRAATSLYRIRKAARPRLVHVVDRFDAATDCADLRAARALLAGSRASTDRM